MLIGCSTWKSCGSVAQEDAPGAELHVAVLWDSARQAGQLASQREIEAKAAAAAAEEAERSAADLRKQGRTKEAAKQAMLAHRLRSSSDLVGAAFQPRRRTTARLS